MPAWGHTGSVGVSSYRGEEGKAGEGAGLGLLAEWVLTWTQDRRCWKVPTGQWQPSSQPAEKQPTCHVTWVQEKGHPSLGWHSRYRRPAGQPASGVIFASVPSAAPRSPRWLLLHPPHWDLLTHPSAHAPGAPQLGQQSPPWVMPLGVHITPSHTLPSLNLATPSSTCPSSAQKGSIQDGMRKAKTPVCPCQRPTGESNLSWSIQGDPWAGTHLCRPGCGRCGSGGPAQGRGAGHISGSEAAPHLHTKHCSLPRGPKYPTHQGQGSQAPPGSAGYPPHRCWGQGRGLEKQDPGQLPQEPSCPALQPSPSLLLSAHQLSQSPVTTSPGSRLSQELSPGPADRLWFSGIPEGMSRVGDSR